MSYRLARMLGAAGFVASTLLGAGCVTEGAPRASGQDQSLHVSTLVRGLEHPWGMAFLPDGRVLVTERPGRLRVVSAAWQLDPEPVAGLPEIASGGQGGLLDVAVPSGNLDPEWVYFSYTEAGDGGVGTAVARGRLRGQRLTDVQVLFRQDPKSTGSRHFGSRLVFDRDGHLYLTLGDRGVRSRAQDLGDHAGSVIRIWPDGGVPEDNPFVGRADARPEVFSYGHRNIQGAALHPESGVLWIHEHGPQGGDEVNVVRPGVNYGWPVITYGVNYVTGTRIGEGTHKEGMAQPLHYWVPSIAPSGMAFYAGNVFPDWRGDLLVGALRGELLARLQLDGETVVRETRLLERQLGRIRDVQVGVDGYVYLLTDAPHGVLARLEPSH